MGEAARLEGKEVGLLRVGDVVLLEAAEAGLEAAEAVLLEKTEADLVESEE